MLIVANINMYLNFIFLLILLKNDVFRSYHSIYGTHHCRVLNTLLTTSFLLTYHTLPSSLSSPPVFSPTPSSLICSMFFSFSNSRRKPKWVSSHICMAGNPICNGCNVAWTRKAPYNYQQTTSSGVGRCPPI